MEKKKKHTARTNVNKDSFQQLCQHFLQRVSGWAAAFVLLCMELMSNEAAHTKLYFSPNGIKAAAYNIYILNSI